MKAVRILNGCEETERAWNKSGNLTGTFYPSSTGNPFVSLVHPGTHKLPKEAPELIIEFFKDFPQKNSDKKNKTEQEDVADRK
jgi:polyhydroxybutyrate depolymerase